MSELVAIGERILQEEQLRLERADAALAVSEVREALPQVLALVGTIAARLSAVEAQLAELTRVEMAPRIRRPVRDASGVILYATDELAGEQ